MIAMITFILLSIVVGAFAFTRITTWYFARRADHAKLAAKCMDTFFESASSLINDDRTPEVVVHYLRCMGHSLRDGAVCRKTLYYWLSGKTLRTHENPPPSLVEFKSKMGALDPELMKSMAMAMVSFAFAVSYHASFSGWLLRRLWLWPVSTPKDQREMRNTGQGLNQVEPFLAPLRPQLACAV